MPLPFSHIGNRANEKRVALSHVITVWRIGSTGGWADRGSMPGTGSSDFLQVLQRPDTRPFGLNQCQLQGSKV